MPLSGPVGERIYYEVYPGPAGAPPLLLLHGFTASAASFLDNIEGLQRRFTVITAELLGHGRSEAPADVDAYAPGPTMDRIQELIHGLGYERVLLCGHSLGGAVALRFALERPEWLDGVVVINSNSAAGTPEWRENARHGLEDMAARAEREGTAFLRDSRLYPAASRRIPPAAREQLVADFAVLTPAGIAGTARALVVDVNAWEQLPGLEVPILVVIGDRDTAFAESAPAFLERLPAALSTWVTLEGAGHAANLEAPGEFNAAVISFAEALDYLPPGGSPPPPRSGGALFGSTSLTVIGAMLVAVGLGMLVTAFVFNGEGEGSAPVAPAEGDAPPPTSTPVDDVAAARTPGDATVAGDPQDESTSTPSATPETDEDAQPTPTDPATSTTAASTPSATPVPPTATSVPPTATPLPPTATPTLVVATATQPPAPTATQPLPTATSTPPPQPSPTPAPTEPAVSIAGPASGEPGETLHFVASGSEAPRTWAWSGDCNQGLQAASCSIPAAEPGCYTITATAVYTENSTSASRVISVGDVACFD